MSSEPMSATPRGPRLPSKLTEIGRAAMRQALLEELERTGWNLSKVAETLGLDTAGNVTRTMQNIGMGEHLERARADRRIRPGRR